MLLGVDLDNTLVCYDGLFHAEAVRRGLLPDGGRQDKDSVREQLRAAGLDKDFTLLQGHIYGPGMAAARPFAGALDCLRSLAAHGLEMCIISHRTRYPYLGPRHDLHASAWNWLKENCFLAPAGPVKTEAVFFRESKEDKLETIKALGCTHFIDDLPEILGHPLFPLHARRLFFAPGHSSKHAAFATFTSWEELFVFLCQELEKECSSSNGVSGKKA